MRRTLAATVVTALIMVIGLATLSQTTSAADGKTLFVEKKCNLCHSIESQGITKKSEKMKGAELSDAGNMIKDAAATKKFLTQEEMKEGEKHQRKWKGTDEELDTIVNWLMTLKKS